MGTAEVVLVLLAGKPNSRFGFVLPHVGQSAFGSAETRVNIFSNSMPQSGQVNEYSAMVTTSSTKV